jgi:WD40 repeat protein
VVRDLSFHGSRPLVATCSDDWTVRLFGVAEGKKKGASLDCLWTYRGHTGPVLAVQCADSVVYSGGIDGSIIAWALPDDLERGRDGIHGDMAAYRRRVRHDAHDDAVWGLRCATGLLLSHGADQCVKLWRTGAEEATAEEDAPLRSIPIGARIVGADLLSASSLVVATDAASSGIGCWDAETGQSTLSFGDTSAGVCSDVRAVPEHSAVVSGHRNSHTCVWDLRSGAAVASFVAHTEAVACLDASASHIVTGSGDAIRLWDFGTRACMSDFVAHRKKFDEGVTTLRLAPSVPGLPPMFASGAGDGIAKIFSQQ